MNKQDKDKYRDVEPIGVYGMNNWGGVEVLGIEYGIEDYVIARFNFGGEPQNPRRCKIRYGSRWDSFRIGNFTVRLDMVMRTEY